MGVPFWDLRRPGMLLAFFAAKVHCWLTFNLLSNKICVLFCFLDSHLQPVLLYEVIPSQGQSLALTFAELHEVPIRPFLQHVEVLLKSSHALQHTGCSPNLTSSAKLSVRSTLLSKLLNSTEPNIDP